MRNTLEETMKAANSSWGPLTTHLVDSIRLHMETLAKTSPEEPWLTALLREQPGSRELYRDPDHGFMLLAHVEQAGLYRAPHDHGQGWVVYAVQQGESEMGTYGRSEDAEGNVRLVKRNSTLVKPGQAQVYLPGDIHDTLCVTGPVLLFRFTERDLKKEDAAGHKVTRYRQRDGFWTPSAP